jgi:hypothetical protein
MLKTFRGLLEKWVPLVQDTDSVDELEQLYWKEIFSKVDTARYGME